MLEFVLADRDLESRSSQWLWSFIHSCSLTQQLEVLPLGSHKRGCPHLVSKHSGACATQTVSPVLRMLPTCFLLVLGMDAAPRTVDWKLKFDILIRLRIPATLANA